MSRKDLLPAEQDDQRAESRGQCEVGAMHRPALARPGARRVERQAIEQHEDQRRQQHVGDQGMARQAVEQAAPVR
jgi:hypothetical protein